MDATVPYSVAISTELGAIAALRQLSTQTTTSSRDTAKALIIGYFKRQTETPRESNMASAKLKKDDLTHHQRFQQLEEAAVKEGLLGFSYEFIEARRELGLPRSAVFPRPEVAVPAYLDTQAEVWSALNATVDPKDHLLILAAYANGKAKKGKNSADLASKLDSLERKLMEHRIYRFSDAFIHFRAERGLPPSPILHSSDLNPGFTLVTGAFSSSSDPEVNAQAAYRFLSRRAVDGYVESNHAVISALEDERTRREDGRALLLLQGFCDHNRRNGYSVEEKLDKLEKELLSRRVAPQVLNRDPANPVLVLPASLPALLLQLGPSLVRPVITPLNFQCHPRLATASVPRDSGGRWERAPCLCPSGFAEVVVRAVGKEEGVLRRVELLQMLKRG